MSSTFKKVIEDFVCEKCGTAVKGNGFTNHCPQCLWSKHVDTEPGDRAMLALCGGMMRPARIEGATKAGGSKGDRGGYMIVHICEKCGIERRNKILATDNFDAALEIIKKNGAALQAGKRV